MGTGYTRWISNIPGTRSSEPSKECGVYWTSERPARVKMFINYVVYWRCPQTGREGKKKNNGFQLPQRFIM